jgi:ubiquinone/menaquinone biosynthesis C-methylase UbiE
METPEENAYVLDAESAAEMARLMRQDVLLTRGMGGAFPEQGEEALADVQRVLDLACGPGGWPLEVAYTYSDMEVVGVDISARMIAYARAQANAQQRTNVRFEIMNILQPLAFAEDSFDLVNARLVNGFVKKEMWPVLLREALRVLRPGGMLRLTEAEASMSNKPSFEKAFGALMQVLARAGMSFSPSGNYHGLIQMLPSLLRQAGVSLIRTRAHFLEFSYGTEAHESFCFDFQSAFSQITPMIEKLGIMDTDEWLTLSSRALAEMLQEDFCAAWTLLTAWGYRS